MTGENRYLRVVTGQIKRLGIFWCSDISDDVIWSLTILKVEILFKIRNSFLVSKRREVRVLKIEEIAKYFELRPWVVMAIAAFGFILS